jgi:hypothetical protein
MRDDGLGLALQAERRHLLDLDRVSRQPERRIPDQDLPRGGGLLQSCGEVDGVARREPLGCARDDLARGDADPALAAEGREGIAHLDGRPHGAQPVVLVDDRDAEHGHHCIADELLDRATVALDDRLHLLEVAREQRPQRFGVELLAQLGRPRHVAEQHGHDLPLGV